MAINGSGVRDTARVLGISCDLVIEVLKKKDKWNQQVNLNYIESHRNASDIIIEIIRVEEAEMDEMWSYVHDKDQQCWLWHAIDHKTGEILAYTFGSRKHKVLRELLDLLKPFDIQTVYADGNYAYQKLVGADKVVVGKRNTQKIERIHLSLRTWVKRLARKTICFSKLLIMHKAVVGLCINVRFFGRSFTE
jgi:IS1 family transposase